jgi:hypothetical protein
VKINENLLREMSIQDVEKRFHVDILENKISKSGVYKFEVCYLCNETEIMDIEKVDITKNKLDVLDAMEIIADYQADNSDDMDYYRHWASSKLVDGVWVMRFDEHNTEEIIKIKIGEK